MIKLYTVFFFGLFVQITGWAQASAPDDLRQLTITGGQTLPETAVILGRQFLGVSYLPHTLDGSTTEHLTVNLRAFDCTTYLETVLALTLAYHNGSQNGVSSTTHSAGTALHPASQESFESAFRSYLTQLRYRNGRIDGYASRLHYFSDWLRDNERKGFLTDITGELAGSMTVLKPISYMTTYVYRYPHLTDPVVYKQIAQTEAVLSKQPFAFIPKKNIQQAETQLREGDIIMLTAARPGLDMKHVGLAVRQPNGRIHLLHASSDHGSVVITSYPLSDYVRSHKQLSGIRVARLRSSPSAATTMVRK